MQDSSWSFIVVPNSCVVSIGLPMSLMIASFLRTGKLLISKFVSCRNLRIFCIVSTDRDKLLTAKIDSREDDLPEIEVEQVKLLMAKIGSLDNDLFEIKVEQFLRCGVC